MKCLTAESTQMEHLWKATVQTLVMLQTPSYPQISFLSVLLWLTDIPHRRCSIWEVALLGSSWKLASFCEKNGEISGTSPRSLATEWWNLKIENSQIIIIHTFHKGNFDSNATVKSWELSSENVATIGNMTACINDSFMTTSMSFRELKLSNIVHQTHLYMSANNACRVRSACTTLAAASSVRMLKPALKLRTFGSCPF